MERVLVIGATSGIGRALAGRLAASGCRVGIVGRRAEPLTERDSDPSENPFFQAAADVTDPAAAVAVLERLVQRMGGMDLCLVAAGAGELNPELDYALELPAIRTNVVGWTAVVDWAYGYFERQGRGHLAVITSVGGLRGSCAAPAYNASKAYQINYTEAPADCRDRPAPRIDRYGHGQGRGALLGDARRPGGRRHAPGHSPPACRGNGHPPLAAGCVDSAAAAGMVVCPVLTAL